MYESKVLSDEDSSSDTEDSDSCEQQHTVITMNGKTRILSGANTVYLPGKQQLQIGDGFVTVVGDSHHYHHVHSHHGPHWHTEHHRTRPLTDSKSIPSRKDLNHVAKHVGNSWKRLGYQLGLSRGQIESIEIDHSVEGHYEMAYQTLLKWQRRIGSRATLKDLAQALDCAGMTDLAGEIPVEG